MICERASLVNDEHQQLTWSISTHTHAQMNRKCHTYETHAIYRAEKLCAANFIVAPFALLCPLFA